MNPFADIDEAHDREAERQDAITASFENQWARLEKDLFFLGYEPADIGHIKTAMRSVTEEWLAVHGIRHPRRWERRGL